jgi:hypothetical protein
MFRTDSINVDFSTAGTKKRKTRGKAKKGATEGTTDEGEGSEGEGLLSGPEAGAEPETASPPRPKPRPKPRPVNRTSPRMTSPLTEPEDMEPDMVVTNVDLERPTPISSTRPKATYRKSPSKAAVRAYSESIGSPEAWPVTPTPSRKRPRLEDEGELPAVAEDVEIAMEGLPDLALSREPTPSSDIQIRRKRVRH